MNTIKNILDFTETFAPLNSAMSFDKDSFKVTHASIWDNGKVIIDETQCNGCGLCTNVCPFGAIKKED